MKYYFKLYIIAMSIIPKIIFSQEDSIIYNQFLNEIQGDQFVKKNKINYFFINNYISNTFASTFFDNFRRDLDSSRELYSILKEMDSLHVRTNEDSFSTFYFPKKISKSIKFEGTMWDVLRSLNKERTKIKIPCIISFSNKIKYKNYLLINCRMMPSFELLRKIYFYKIYK